MANSEFTSVTCGDNYTDAATVRDVFNSGGGVFEVAAQPAIYKLQHGGRGMDYWTPEAVIGTGGGTIPPGVEGVAFRNAVAGNVAVVSALIRPAAQPHLALSFASPIVNVNTVQVLFDSKLTAPAAFFDTGSIIPAGSRALQCFLTGRSAVAAATETMNVQFNGDVAANYEWEVWQGDGAGVGSGGGAGGAIAVAAVVLPGAAAFNPAAFGEAEWTIPNYDNPSNWKPLSGTNHFQNNVTLLERSFGGAWRNVTAGVTRIVVSTVSGSGLVAGSRFTVIAV